MRYICNNTLQLNDLAHQMELANNSTLTHWINLLPEGYVINKVLNTTNALKESILESIEDKLHTFHTMRKQGDPTMIDLIRIAKTIRSKVLATSDYDTLTSIADSFGLLD